MDHAAGPSNSRSKRTSGHDEQEGGDTKRVRTSYSETLTVLAGEIEEPIVVHKDIICRRSDFFVAACSKDWIEGREKTVRLESVDPKTFFQYVDWAYTGKIDLHITDVAPEDNGGPRLPHGMKETNVQLQLARLYVAADMLLDSALRNKVVDELILLVTRDEFMWGRHCIPYVWQETAANCGLRRFYLDYVGSTMDERAVKSFRKCGYLPDDFMCDLALRQLKHRGKEVESFRPEYWSRCNYHDHDESTDERQRCQEACAPGGSGPCR